MSDFTIEQQGLRIAQQIQNSRLRKEFNLLGIETATGEPVVWCGFHDIDWNSRQCETGFWVRKRAHGRGFATEATNALLRYAFSALAMRRVGINRGRAFQNDAFRTFSAR